MIFPIKESTRYNFKTYNVNGGTVQNTPGFVTAKGLWDNLKKTGISGNIVKLVISQIDYLLDLEPKNQDRPKYRYKPHNNAGTIDGFNVLKSKETELINL
ncbi:MAG: hypothetical protein FWG18_02915, partial [Alphaproteobacteria bacterium]|nr:hypothetical protein [Alphaproteobacteria bacterium]